MYWGEQEKTKRTINEIKIPVRVFSEGKPIDTLQKSDFKIFLSGQYHPIRQFKLVRRTLIPDPSRLRNPRLFLLLSNISHHNLRIQQYLEYLFDQVLQVNDQLILVFDTGTYKLNCIKHKHQAFLKINRMMKRHGSMLNQTQIIDIKRLEEAINYLRQNTESISGNDAETVNGGRIHQHYYMKYFKSSLARYLNTLQTYIRRYFFPDLNRYQKLMANLKNFPGEKWIIHLCQMGIVPRISKKNRTAITNMVRNLNQRDWTVAWKDEIDYAKQIKKLLADIDDSLNISTEFPSKEITDLLYTYNWTFNSICFADRSDRHSTDTGPDHFEKKIKKKWQQVTEMTGGCFIDSDASISIPDSLGKVNDIFYLLLLNPEYSSQPKKIEIKLPYHDHRILYPSEIRPGFIAASDLETALQSWKPDISEIAFNQNKLSIIISNLSPEKTKKSRKGKIQVHIQIVDNQNRLLFDEQKSLLIEKDTIGITLGIDWLKRGKHTVIIEIMDLFTGMADLKLFQVD